MRMTGSKGTGAWRLILASLMLVAMTCHADSELRVAQLSSQVSGSSDLGTIDIDGVGAVKLTANKSNNALTVHAMDAAGKVIGKAETVIGLKDTPIYVSTSTGLHKITIYWGQTQSNTSPNLTPRHSETSRPALPALTNAIVIPAPAGILGRWRRCKVPAYAGTTSNAVIPA